ncbi:MAG TPA: hypothetical protein VFS21_21910 [Roseiflexaceae bacterium]|nr:hypothetical protein [Roseiflexaceae bacterium]
MLELVITEEDGTASWRVVGGGEPVAGGQGASVPAAMAAALLALLEAQGDAGDAAGRAAQLSADAAADRLGDADAGRILRQALSSEAGPLVAAALAASGVRLAPIAPPPGWLDDFFKRQIAKRKPSE